MLSSGSTTLCKRYGGLAAVDGVSFEVAEGQTSPCSDERLRQDTILRVIAGLESA